MKINLLFAFLFFLLPLKAQRIQYGWHNFTTNDGLPSPEVYTVIQDAKGLLWFGTDNGVSRYDGYSFTNFGAKEGLTDNVINSLQEDAAGRIWFGSMWGKVFYWEKDTIHAFKYNHLIEAYRHLFYVVAGISRFEKDKNTEGGILVGLTNVGILKIYDNGQSELITTPKPPALLVFPSKDRYIVVSQTIFNRTSIPADWTLTQPVFMYDGQNLIEQGSFKPSSQLDFIGNARLKKFADTTYLFTGSGIHRKTTKSSFSTTPYDRSIYDILADEDGLIWTAESANGGVKAFKNAEAIGKSSPQILLEGVSAVTLLRDRDGGYWVTTLEEGVFYLRDKRMLLFNKQNTAFPFDILASVEPFDASKVFVGFRQGEVGTFDKTTNTYQSIARLSKDNIYDMKWDARLSQLWFGGLVLRKWQEGQLTPLTNTDDNKIISGVKNIALGLQKGDKWIISAKGLHNIKGLNSTKKFSEGVYSTKNRLFSVFEDRQQRVWLGKQDGLYRLEKDSLVAVGASIHAALTTRVEDIAELPDGSLVFATKGKGLVIWDGKEAVNIRTNEGLQTDMIEKVVTDSRGNIWVGTLAGLHKISPLAPKKEITHSLKEGNNQRGQWHVQAITLFHGLPTNEINDIAPTSEGTNPKNTEGVFLATPKGLVFYRDAVSVVATPPPFFERMTGGKKNYTDLATALTLEHDENDVELAWNTINFRMSGKIPYRYRLDSMADWRTTLNRNVVLAALSAGHYRFEVQAQNEEGTWSSSLIVPFFVKPVWYTTTGFRLFLIGLAALGSYIFYQTRLKRLKTEFDLQLHINNLERTALAMQMNPHFIFNCLNSIQLLIQRNAKGDAMTYLSRFARLVRFNLESTRRGSVTLDEETTALDNYLTLEKLRFKEGLAFSIDIDEEIDGFDTEIPAMLIQPFVENAVKHGFSIDDESAKISVRFRYLGSTKAGNFTSHKTNAGTKVPDYILVEIKDNGKGIDRNALNLNAQNLLEKPNTTTNSPTSDIPNPTSTGVGIALSRQRLALHNGGDTPDDLRIETLLGAEGQVLGTVVLIKIRLNNE